MMTYELDEAFVRACQDDDIKVIILAADGPHWSSGHDQTQRGVLGEIKTKGTWFGYDLPGIEGKESRNRETYFDMYWRWRNLSKPLIGQVHGKSIGGGLMLLFICDVLVASEDASFADPTVAVGVNGVEFFGHPWDFGTRKAKEMLFTSDFVTAEEAYRLGMLNHVVPREALESTTLEIARKAAKKPSWGLKLAKEAVNAMADGQNQYSSMRAAFSLCSLGHAQAMLLAQEDVGFGEGFLQKRSNVLRSEWTEEPTVDAPDVAKE